MNDLVGPWVRRFLVEYVMGERNYSPNTQHSYRDTFRLLLPLAAKQCRCTVENLTVNGIKPKLLREFIRYLEQVRHCGPATINQRLAALRAWSRFVAAHSPEHLEWSTQLQTIHLKKCAPAPVSYLEKEEMQALLSQPDRRPAWWTSNKSTASSSNPIGGKTVTNPSPKSTRWTREQIRAARLAPLVPLLQKRGLQFISQDAGNVILPAYPGLIVKDSYWRWPERNLAGNAIDFCVQVLGLSFHDAMRLITGA